MADTMALEPPQGVFQTNEPTPDEMLVGNNDVVMREADEKDSRSTSLVKSSNVTEFLSQPLVKRTIPAVIGLFLVLLF